MTSNITVSKDLFDVANADDGEKLELARIGLIDLSVSELIAIAGREREAVANNPRVLAKADLLRARNMRLAKFILTDPGSSPAALELAGAVLNREKGD
jgi:hypothetical protein